MTMYIVFEEMKAGRLRSDDPVVLSQARGERGLCRPSRLGRQYDHRRTALTSLVVKSLNDVAVALGEKVSGSDPPSPSA